MEQETCPAAHFICQYRKLHLKMVFAYPLTPFSLSFAYIDETKISPDI